MTAIDERASVKRSRASKEISRSPLQVLTHTYPAGFIGGLHRHDSEEILYVMSGSIRLSIDGQRKTYREGDIAFIPAHAEHGFATLMESRIDVYQSAGVTTYLTVSTGERVDNEIVILETVPVRSSEEIRMRRYTPRPAVGGRHVANWTMR
jgi:quercetin dioxygenase-like cupin family protein